MGQDVSGWQILSLSLSPLLSLYGGDKLPFYTKCKESELLCLSIGELVTVK